MLQAIMTAIIETIEESGEMGAPGGVMYAALMSAGVTLGQFESLMAAIVATGRVRKSGDCYLAVR